ncbi:cytochrome c6 isoform A [Chlorella sorokiniana]|uniref:Cytochrome c-553 n=1 Tax=Chlorella sorokiniana TaxID=3076 RepID=A0A2P6TRF7_CHLSO|nr:cytochrome c6 isoform A [Chlorella sorokiniana]|eukprot:PRW56638.1 cytochrome c6 isoform A [Chlorella sorokiniana]
MPAPAAAADLKLGREVFEANCAVCHMGGLNNIPGEEKHTLKRDALEKYGLFSQQAIESQVHILADGGALRQVRSGKDAMPPFQGSLSDEEITAVAAFVYSQAAGDLW